MNRPEQLEREVASLRDRLSRLSEASLRINETLDYQSVLLGVLESACSLTGARYGVITLVDQSGRVEDHVYSGLTPEQTALFMELPDGLTFFDHLSRIEEPLRLDDFHGHVRQLGLPEFHPPMPVSHPLPFLAAPIRHLGEGIGAIYVGEKEQEFTHEDEKTLVMFASQAALVIANARRHREELRVRADLETLVNTAPVGVVVFDARNGKVEYINQEMRRIVSGLHGPDSSAEKIVGLLTLRRADGREVSLQEFQLTYLLSIGETVRAEEIVLRVPDGRSITTLLNATPIHSKEGEVESFVITFQDMTPQEELERLRSEFLGMVSHELRTPLSTIKGSVDTLLEAASELDSAETAQFHRIIRDQSENMRYMIADLLDVARIETGSLPVDPERSEVRDLVDEARRRFQDGGNRNRLEMDISSHLPQVMADRRRIIQVLGNLLSNAARYSHQSSTIRIAAEREGVHVAFSVSDHGAGLDVERMPHLFRKFSRLEGEERDREIGGSGLGLAICKGIVEAHGGRIWAESDGPGRGSRFCFTIPAVGEAASSSAQSSSREQRRRRPRILCVDDDPRTLRYVRTALSKEGYEPIVTADPEEVFDLVEKAEPRLVLLDLVLPGRDGIELMKEIRNFVEVPVIFLSVYGQDETVARAFDMGAADYIVKPFSTTELVARIRAALRRRVVSDLIEPSEPFLLGDLTIDYAQNTVTVAGRPIRLTDIEYRMLAELSVGAGRVLTNVQLLQRVWGLEKTGGSGPVRNIIKRLRQKLGDDARNPTYIFNEPRVGYRMPKGE